MKIHAVQPWDSPDADVMDWHERDYRASDSRYKGRNECLHPDCKEWIRDDAHTCKPHRDWYWAETHGQGEQDRRRRHRQIVALVASGMTVIEAVAERNRIEKDQGAN